MNDKKELLNNILKGVVQKKKRYYALMLKYKRIDDLTESFIIACGTISVSSLVTTLASSSPPLLIVGTVFSSISTLSGAIKRSCNVTLKYESYKTSYNQLADLERETRAVLVKNHLNGEDLTNLLNEVNQRLSLIEDTSQPIHVPKN